MAKPKRKKQRQQARRHLAIQVATFRPAEKEFRPYVTSTPDTYREPTLVRHRTHVTFSRFRIVRVVDEDGQEATLLELTGDREEMWLEPYQEAGEEGEEVERVGLRMPDDWTPEAVKGWLAAALDVERRLPTGRIYPAGHRSSMPDVVRDASEAYGYGEVQVREPVTPAEVAMMEFVLPDWLLMLEDATARRALCGVCLGLPLRLVGKVAGCSHEQARKLADRSAERIATRLNCALKAA